MSKYYAVKKGTHPGIYNTWNECEKEVKGYSGAVYKSFSTLKEAENFLEEKPLIALNGSMIAYVDGSYNIKTKEYGYGVVMIESQQVIDRMYGKGNHPDYVEMRNVSGEIFGSLVAIKYAVDHGQESIVIYYDYEGIEKWANDLWKANKPGTKYYKEQIANYRTMIDITFVKVLAHSGDYYNEEADQLAKRAVGIL